MAESESEKNASVSSRRTNSWGRGARLPGQLPPSVQETARDCPQGPPSCQDNCLLLGSVAKVSPSNCHGTSQCSQEQSFLLLFNSRLMVGPRQPPLPLPCPLLSSPTLWLLCHHSADSAAPSWAMWEVTAPVSGSFSHHRQGTPSTTRSLAPEDQPETSQS